MKIKNFAQFNESVSTISPEEKTKAVSAIVQDYLDKKGVQVDEEAAVIAICSKLGIDPKKLNLKTSDFHLKKTFTSVEEGGGAAVSKRTSDLWTKMVCLTDEDEAIVKALTTELGLVWDDVQKVCKK